VRVDRGERRLARLGWDRSWYWRRGKRPSLLVAHKLPGMRNVPKGRPDEVISRQMHFPYRRKRKFYTTKILVDVGHAQRRTNGERPAAPHPTAVPHASAHHGHEFSPTNELETSSRLDSRTRSLRSSAATTLSMPSSINNDSNAGRESGIVDVGTDRFAHCIPIPSLGCATYQREERQCCSGRNTGLAQAHHKPRWHEAQVQTRPA